ncbi:LOW QUALITY PROTEIN: autophagy-related protein 2 homolog A-like [Acropora millepora]|uniref:LOW QUALITY PROTEIN: autophagy-related protein 2 homolog A-like n=1 Tax=Acropora millepora TaxID=45264 RepID=UPI001CF144BC|nr:LOW QUALITY PROTEIN: autophagy-related protein 2 homolog A-like [Acropora millepora]
MPWFFPWSDFIKKRACRYLLQHYLGHFLQEKLTLDQLTVDLYNGTGRVDKVPVDVWSVNEMLDNAGIPVEMIDGFIGSISVSVPWTALLSESCCMDIQGLEVTIAPRQRVDTGGSMTDSMVWNAMTTSMQLAQECLKEDPSTGEEQAEASPPFEGLESFAQTIESVLARVKLSFTDTVIRFEHLVKDTKTGIGLEIHIKRIEYSDLSTELAERDIHYKPRAVYEPAACACKKLKIFGLSVHLDEFPEDSRTMPLNRDYPDSLPPSPGSGSCSLPPHHLHNTLEGGSLSAEEFFTSSHSANLLPQIKVATFAGQSEVKLKLKQNVALPGPKVDVECFLGTLNVFLSPKQIHLLTEFSSGFLIPDLSSPSDERGQSVNKPMKPEDYQKIEQDLQNQLMSKKLQEQRNQQAQQRVNSWNFNFDSSTTNDVLSHYSPGSDYDSILGEEEEETFYSMSSNHESLPPLEEPELPVDMLKLNRMPSGSNLLHQTTDFSPLGTLGVLQSSPRKLLTNTIANDKRFVNQKIHLTGKGTSLTEAAESVFVSSQQTLNEAKTDGHSRHIMSSAAKPGLAGIAALDDPCPDVTKVAIKLTSLAVTLLHIDPVLSPTSGVKGSPQDDSVHPLTCLADKFFSNLGTYGFGGKDFDDMTEKFVAACSKDHLRCMAAPLSFEFEKTVSGSHLIGKSELSAGKVHFSECLFERSTSSSSNPMPYSTTELLKFLPREKAAAAFYGFTPSSTRPCFKLKYKSTQRTTASPNAVQGRSVVVPKAELSVELGNLLCEFDVSIMDRLTALLDPQPVFVNQPSNMQSRMFRSCNPSLVNQQAVFTQAMEDSPVVEQPFTIHLTCPSLTVVLRFPIPDLRPTMDRRPWWKQALRKERLTFEFSAVEFNTSHSGSEQPCNYNFSFKELQGHFQEDISSTRMPVIAVTHGPSESDTGGFDWPRIVVTVQPPAPLSALEEVQSSDNSPLSSIDAYPVMKSDPSPFSSRPVMFETEELLMPGSQEEMSTFQEDTVTSSKVHVECTFPRLDVNLHSKDVFENIYNRLASDLLLWEPMAPSLTDRADPCGFSIGAGLDLASQMLHTQGPDRFVMCRSGLRSYDDDASSSEEGSSYFTSLESRYKRNASIPNGQTAFTLSLNVTKARLAIFPISEAPSSYSSSKDSNSSSEKVLGEIVAEFNDVMFFVAACYKSQVDLSYLCLHSQKVAFQHAPMVPQGAHVSMESAFSGAELQSTFYHTEPSMRHSDGKSGEPMFSFAIKASSDATKNIKEILFSLGLRRCTLRHRMVSSKQLWLTQITNFFDVKDDPVLGFSPPTVVTVFHTHVWEGAIDYRPIHLPLRVLLTLETFNVSSNLTIESNVSLLRFIIDDAALYLSDKCSGSANIKNYVCVLDLGMFELSLFTSDSREQGQPQVQLRMSNNIVNVRTCSDSFFALLQLIQYIAADGDLVPSYEPEPPDTAKTPTTPSRCPAEPPVKQGSVDDGALSTIMNEAMVDSHSAEEAIHEKGSRAELNHQLSRSPRRDLFLFPDDEMLSALEEFSPSPDINPNAHVGNVGQEGEEEEEEDSDDDFCILEHPDREPDHLSHEVIIKSLTGQQVNIVENHFSIPIGPSDQLSAPSHFPPAVFSYTVKEMSVAWHLYGGRDFGATPTRDQKKRISFAVDEKGHPVTNFSVRPTVLNPPKPTSNTSKKLSRKSGGPNRNNHVLMEFYLNKIRLQYEEYPEDTEQASRLVFLVQDVEIRDRLAQSQINKFLYQYTSEACPKQTHANMIMLKMLYIRPDAGLKAQECNMRVSIQPLRLNVDQDALFFLRMFFSEIIGEAANNPKGSSSVDSSPVKAAVPNSDWLVRSSDGEETLVNSACGSEVDAAEPAPTFFRSFIFSPEVPIRLDYQGKRVDMEQGTLAGLLIGLGQLNCSELRLKRLCCRSGLLGIDRVVNYALSEWLADIRGTQLPRILGGVGPVHSFLQLFQGLVDLVWLPIDQYRRDGRVMRGLQRGANSFTTSSAMAFLELTNRVVQIIQAAAETAYDVVSPASPVKRGQNRLAQQPADLREGVTNAYQVFREGLGQTATNIVQVAKEEHEQKGVTGAVGGVLRQVPATVVQPLILATEATSNVLGGVRNQILPDARKEATEKWRASP